MGLPIYLNVNKTLFALRYFLQVQHGLSHPGPPFPFLSMNQFNKENNKCHARVVSNLTQGPSQDSLPFGCLHNCLQWRQDAGRVMAPFGPRRRSPRAYRQARQRRRRGLRGAGGGFEAVPPARQQTTAGKASADPKPRACYGGLLRRRRRHKHEQQAAICHSLNRNKPALAGRPAAIATKATRRVPASQLSAVGRAPKGHNGNNAQKRGVGEGGIDCGSEEDGSSKACPRQKQ